MTSGPSPLAAPRGPEAPEEAGLVEAFDLTKSYGSVEALRNVGFDLGSGEIHGLCGHNGAGKSTLVKILVGLERPDGGAVRVKGKPVALHGPKDAQRLGIALVDQELSLVPELTVAENVFLGNVRSPFLRWRSVEEARAKELLDQLGLRQLSPAQLVGDLAIGERQLVEIARLLGRNAEVLILDEPTATLTDAEIDRVFDAVRAVVSHGASVIFVSHRLDELLSLCDRVTVLRDGCKVATRPVAGLSKGQIVEMMLGPAGQEEAPEPITTRRRPGGVGIHDLRVGTRVEGFSLEAPRGAIVGLAGQVGSGASDILRAIAGLAPDMSGTISVDGRQVPPASPYGSVKAGVQFVSNDRKGEGLFLGQSTEYNLVATRTLALSRLGVLRTRLLRQTSRRLVELVGVDAGRLSAPVERLSGGNQQKVLVGRCLDRSALNLLLLDEPTRGVDVGGRAEIHRLLVHAAASGATVMFASSELDEIVELSDVVVTLFAGRVVETYSRPNLSAATILADMTHRRETAA